MNNKRTRPNNAEKTVFISGNFNVLHAGHIRLFAYAKRFADKLIVGVNGDEKAGNAAYVKEGLRLEAVKTNSWVDQAMLVKSSLEEVIRELKPQFIVKGKEFENQDNPESDVLSEFGGRLIFGSVELPLSSIDLMRKELSPLSSITFNAARSYAARHEISSAALQGTVDMFKTLHVCVVGDLIIDEYVTCESLGMSQEDPSLVVKPLDKKRFLGGAGIVAAHAGALGASSQLITILGDDDCGRFAERSLQRFNVNSLSITDDSRPTTLKQRYRAKDKTLLRVSHLSQQSISPSLQQEIFKKFMACSRGCDLVVFSDFNYGCLPNGLIEKCTQWALQSGIVCVADSQCSSQVGDVSRFKGMNLISATEREVRISLRDNDDGLTVLAERIREASQAENVMIKLGDDGVIIHSSQPEGRVITSQLPAFNSNPVDVAGAGDSMLVTAGMALALGKTIWEAAAIGSIAAALQISSVGNVPLAPSDLRNAVSQFH